MRAIFEITQKRRRGRVRHQGCVTLATKLLPAPRLTAPDNAGF
jgi:hypothetical protein